MKKNFKRFFTLKHKANDGFTLVELIVVIAILAILSGIAVPAYSGYVKKANMQADISLAAEVADALELQHYMESAFEGEAIVFITENSGLVPSNDFAEKAVQNTFGDNTTGYKLSYDGWGSNVNTVANVVNHFKNSYDNDSATADIYTGEKKPTFVNEIENLFDTVEEVATGIFQEESADSVKAAASTTISNPMDADAFSAQWAKKEPWGNQITGSDQSSVDVANAAVVKARNVSIAEHIKATLKSAGTYSDDDINSVYTLFADNTIPGMSVHPQDVVADMPNIKNKHIANGTTIGWAAVQGAYNSYFTNAENATNDGLAYYAMMETVNSVEVPEDTEDAWNSMSDAVDVYAQLARGEITLDDVSGVYSNLSGAGKAVSVSINIADGTYTVKAMPENVLIR